MEVMRHVARLHRGQHPVLRLVGKVLDAVAELVEAGRQQAGRKGRHRRAETAQRPADGNGGGGNGRERGVERAEQDLQMIGVMVVIVMYALPGSGCQWRFAYPAAVQHPAVKHVPDRSEEHTSELQSLMRISYAVFCL